MGEVIVTAIFDGQRVVAYRGTVETPDGPAGCGRWAEIFYRDWWVNPGVAIWDSDPKRETVTKRPGPAFLRDPSLLCVLSDGTVFGGEMSRYFAERRCVEWVREGKR